MIEPISPNQKEWDKSYSNYGVTKFIGKNGDGYRGVIVEIDDGGCGAMLYALNGEYAGKIIKVEETNPDEWAAVV